MKIEISPKPLNFIPILLALFGTLFLCQCSHYPLTTQDDFQISYRPLPKTTDQPHESFDYENPNPFEENRLPGINSIPDPLEPVNRVSFWITDKTMYWLIEPILIGYRFVIPKPIRQSVSNFYHNIRFPIRFFGNALQGKGQETVLETRRFLVNSFLGVGGLFDVAKHTGLQAQEEEFGQVFGKWGFRPGFYLFLPFLGPSSGRDAVGEIINTAANPLTYVSPVIGSSFSFLDLYLSMVNPIFTLNELSFSLDQLRQMRKSQIDPYHFFREFWAINRQFQVRDYTIPEEELNGDSLAALMALSIQSNMEFIIQGKELELEEEPYQDLPYTLWLQDNPAPVVFIVPGIGSHRNSPMSRFFGRIAFQQGYHVVTISNFFHWEFIRYASNQRAPGFTPHDNQELENILILLREQIETLYPGRFQENILMGYSHGALHTLFMAGKGRDENLFPIERYVAVGGPIDPYFAMKQLDRFYDAPMDWPEEERLQRIENTLLKAAAVFSGRGKDLKSLPFSRKESEFLLGLANRFTLQETLVAIDQYQNSSELITPQTFSKRQLYREVGTFRFEDYVRRMVISETHPDYIHKKIPLNHINEVGIRQFEENLRFNPSLRVLINQDDSLLNVDDIEFLKNTLDSRVTVFPYGGHMGNVMFPEVLETFRKSIKIGD